MLIDLTEDLFLKNDATTRVPWMVFVGCEKQPANVAILLSTERDDAGRFDRFYLSVLSWAPRRRSPD